MKQPIRVIYVDDDPQMARLLPRALALSGINVLTTCTSAEELIAMRGTATYKAADIFVTDVQLPKMTGVELAWALRAGGERRPILITSAWSEEVRWQLAKMNVAYLQKPYEFEDLECTIKRLVRASKVN